MERRSRSGSPRRNRNVGNCTGLVSTTNTIGGGDVSRYNRRYSRSRSRSREKSRDARKRSRSRSRERHRHGDSPSEKDLYRDLINDDYNEDNRSRSRSSRREYGRDYDRDYDRDRDRDRDRRRHRRRSDDRDEHSDDSDESGYNNHYYNKTPSKTIIVMGLQQYITEADIMSSLIQVSMQALSIRLIRKRNTGASRGFAFVEFKTIDEAARWMELTQGILTLPDQTRANLQYSHSREQGTKTKGNLNATDWYCAKCGVFNFKRRESCFKCYASREESERGGEGSDEVSNILTKKIMLRNLDALTNEESVITAMQLYAPDLAKKISKIQVSRDVLTQTSRGICYLNFESLIDSMNVHNVLTALVPPLNIDNREIVITYCMDHENRQIVPKKSTSDVISSGSLGVDSSASSNHYTLADVPRLAEYSAAMYASTPTEHAHYLKYYTDYYIAEINKGHFANLPSIAQLNEVSANSAAAVALSAIQRKQKKMNSIETTATQAAAAAAIAAAQVKAAFAAQNIVTPRGNDGKIYPTPDVTQYQYDETSGYYYDPSTGLYYDAHSQYYYNSETGAYLYWDQRKSTYVLATPDTTAAAVRDFINPELNASVGLGGHNDSEIKTNDEESKKDKKDKPDKVKVAKKIVKDMEKWAKQLNQKKDYTVVATPQPLLTMKSDEGIGSRLANTSNLKSGSSAYADVGFSILEKKDRNKLSDYVSPSGSGINKLNSYGSDSDEEHNRSAAVAASPSTTSNKANTAEVNEKDYVDFQKLTCLLCKRAFQSLEILQKHLKMSNLHKENLQKFNLTRSGSNNNSHEQEMSSLSYRDRAKERRLKYGESDPPPPNRSRERFENEIKSLTSRSQKDAPAMPIGSNNVGNRLLQKMGWSEGQGLGRKNQGRTNIIEASARSSTAGLGTKSGLAPGDDYKTYIKKMMKSRYESV